MNTSTLTANHMDNLVGDFVAELTLMGRSTRTVRLYRQVATSFGTYLKNLGEPVLETLLPVTIEDFLNTSGRTDKPISAATWNLRRSVVSSFFNFLLRQGRVTRKPTDLVPRRRVRRHAVQTLTLDERLAMLDAVDEHSSADDIRLRNRLILLTLMYSGVRLAELVSLDATRLDLEGHRFLQMHRKGGDVEHVSFGDMVGEAIEQYLPVRDAIAGPDEPALFVTHRTTTRAPAGARLSHRSVQAMITRIAKRAGITRRVYPHIMRHSFATGMIRSGTDLPTLQDQLGHTSGQMSMRYAHSDDARRREAINRFEAKHRTRAEERTTEKSAKSSETPPPDPCV